MAKNKKSKLLGKIGFGTDNKNNIETVVLKCFIRVLKNNGSYMLYRRCVNNTGIMKSIVKQTSRISADNPFSSASSSEQVISTLRKITNDMAKSNGKKGGINDLDKYEIVTMAINHLLHFFMESNGVSMQRLCELGEEIYGLSCNKLFGDTIEDLEKQSEEELASMTDINRLKAKLFQDYIVDLQQGNIPSSTSFDDYVSKKIDKTKIKELEKATPEMDEQVGYMLGRGPADGDMRIDRPAWLDNGNNNLFYIDDDEDEDEDGRHF